MGQISRMGIDTSKQVLEFHGVNTADTAHLPKELRREMAALFGKLTLIAVVIKACAPSHYWSRVLQSKPIAPQLIKPPYLKRNKNNAANVDALCEAMSRSTMRYVPPKPAEQKAALMLVDVRDWLIRK